MVAYYRVSTDKQRRSGLGLEAQQAAVLRYIDSLQGTLVSGHTEIETGIRDTLANRPELKKAIARAKRERAVLVIAKLDRLARSVAVVSLLHSSGVEFVCCDNPHANRLTIQILAAVAEDEARRISERTKAALAAYKARGGLLGASLLQCRNLTRTSRLKGAYRAAEARQLAAQDAYADILQDLQSWRSSGKSLQDIASRLNFDGHTTRRGRPWNPVQVSRILRRAENAQA